MIIVPVFVEEDCIGLPRIRFFFELEHCSGSAYERAMVENHNVHRLAYGDKEVVVVGTAHVSRESVDLVGRVIEEEKPDTVCVELCQSRFQSLTQRTQWQEMDLIKVIRSRKSFLLLSNLLLSYFQRKIGKQLGVRPGEEMLRAIDAAQAVGAGIHLVDRDVGVSLSRTWRLMRLRSKLKLFFQLLGSVGELDSLSQEDVEKMKNRDILETLLLELGEAHPEITRSLIEERDQYLAEKIRTAPGDRIVAVVGAGHVPGIQKYWKEPVDLEALSQVPPKSRLWGCLKWIIPTLMIGLVILGFFIAGPAAGTRMIGWWILANAVLAGLGAVVALGHPLTVLAAALASPVTSLNPMVGAGWVSGIVEAFLGKPKVRDFENLTIDIASLSGFWRNKITRILLVVLFTNMGSALGTFVAIPFMVKAFS